MGPASLEHPALPDPIGPEEGDVVAPCLDIAFDERAGWVRVYDPRLFHVGRRDFCERLLEAAARQPEVHKAEIDFASSSCQIEFGPGSTVPRSMTEAFVRAVREATAGPSWFDRISWWRRRGRWSTRTAFRLPDGAAVWEAVAVKPDRLRLRRPGVAGDRAQLSRLADALAELEGVEACHVSRWSHRITLDVRRDSPLPDRFLDTVEQSLARVSTDDSPEPEPRASDADGGVVVVSTGWKRLMYLGMAGGSLALTTVGLIVPGIPTVPFLLATSYYLARSSPRLDDRLRHTPALGPILAEWEQRGGLSRFSKRKLAGLTLVIAAVTVVLAGLTPVILVVIVLVSSLSIFGIARMPGLEEGPDEGARLDGKARLKLVAP